MAVKVKNSAMGMEHIRCVCAKVIKKAVSIYMEIFGYPPMFEGARSKGTSFSLNPGGLDFYTPFIEEIYCSLTSGNILYCCAFRSSPTSTKSGSISC